MPVAQVHAQFLRREFYQDRYRESGIETYQIKQFGASAQGFLVAVEMEVPLEMPAQMPKALRRWVREQQPVHYALCWHAGEQAPFRAHFSYDPQGVPLRLTGELTLNALNETHTHYLSQVKVYCDVPLLGGALARLFAGRVEQELRADVTSLKGYLSMLEDNRLEGNH